MQKLFLSLPRRRRDNDEIGATMTDALYDYWDKRGEIQTPDGDFFHVDHKYYSKATPTTTTTASSTRRRRRRRRGTVVLLHGLKSNSNSTLSLELANSYVRMGFDVSCVNFRGFYIESILTTSPNLTLT